MPVVPNLHRPVSRRGQWRGSHLIVASDTPVDIDGAVFRFTVWPKAGGCCRRDYGHWRHDPRVALSARTDDDSGQFVVAPTTSGLACTWLFPAERMRGFCAGSYEASISVAIGDEDAELAVINFVVR